MTNSQRLATVRARLLQWLAKQGEPGELPGGSDHPITQESILIRDEYYCGRRFHTAAHQAVWFIEEDELKIYRNSGELECVLTGQEISDNAAEADKPQPQRTAEIGLPAVIKMPPPVEANGETNAETNLETNDDSDNEIRRAA
jgi:hypothetical protein